MNLINYSPVWQQAMEMPVYWRNFEETLSSSSNEDPNSSYLPINWQRVQRISKNLILRKDWEDWITSTNIQLNWLIISEHWCGDAAQILPVLERMAEVSQGKVNIKVIYRDKNEEVMDQHLTNGSRSIPKVICLDPQFKLLGDWGPRPTEAQALRSQFKENPKAYAHALHVWYGRNNQVAIQEEVLAWTKSMV